MTSGQFQHLAAAYPRLRIAIIGDFCLDRYLEIDPARAEISIETNLRVHNVVNVRSQPGAAGTILNNLVALGIGTIYAAGFCGVDGEGFELQRALRAKKGVRLDHFLETAERRTFTYCKPLLMHEGKVPEELNRLDSKNWTPTPASVEEHFIQAARALAPNVDAIILMDQVDIAETGVVTSRFLQRLREVIQNHPQLLILADSRRGLQGFPPICPKMNAAELGRLVGKEVTKLEDVKQSAVALAQKNGRRVFVTLSERGIVGASPEGKIEHVTSLPLRGEIDIVGAGDAVTANLTAALAAGGSLRDAVTIANTAASIVIHQLGTTGTASVEQISASLG